MKYMKLVTKGMKHHLSATYYSSGDCLTLCGCTVTRPHSWKQIRSLEGDECAQCASLAFRGSAAITADRAPAPR